MSQIRAFTAFAIMTMAGLFVWGWAMPARAEFQVPDISSPVEDKVGVLDTSQRAELDQLIRQLKQRGKMQLQVLVMDTLAGEPIEQASIEIVEKFQLGSQKEDNGVLFLVVVNDKKMRIEVGQGLEGVLTDIVSRRITSDVVKPFFKAGQMGLGIKAGVYAIASQVDPEAMGAGAGINGGTGTNWSEQPLFSEANLERQILNHLSSASKIELFFYALFFILFLVSSSFRSAMGGRRRFGRSYGGGPFIGGGGFGGRSSGGWSGGGGGFSGGGSSDSW